MLKAGQCRQADEQERIGTPLAPTPFTMGYVTGGDIGNDGYLRGDVCDCTPPYQPYAYTSMCLAEGGVVLLDTQFGVSKSQPLTIDECYAACDRTLNCKYFVFWPSMELPFDMPQGMCKLFNHCQAPPITCPDVECQTGTIYIVEAIGQYKNERGTISTPQLIYPLRGVQTSRFECLNCMRQFPEPDCVFHCGEPVRETFQHYPGGQSCGNCMFAGNYMHELNANEYREVKDCVYASIAAGEDPWTSCNKLVIAQGTSASNSHGVDSALKLFNGVATHYMTECPGRAFKMFGATCAPNLHAREFFTAFVLHHKASKNNTVWPVEQFDCMNAICELVSRDQCYAKLATYDFEGTGTGLDQVGNLHLLPTGTGLQIVQGQGLIFNKTMKDSFMVTPFIKKSDMQDVTLEVWTTIPAEEGVTDVAQGRFANSTSESGWLQTYQASKALDQDLDTYWQSALFTTPIIEITYEIDFGKVVWAEGWKITWMHRAQAAAC
jgi:hypothetical protein